MHIHTQTHIVAAAIQMDKEIANDYADAVYFVFYSLTHLHTAVLSRQDVNECKWFSLATIELNCNTNRRNGTNEKHIQVHSVAIIFISRDPLVEKNAVEWQQKFRGFYMCAALRVCVCSLSWMAMAIMCKCIQYVLASLPPNSFFFYKNWLFGCVHSSHFVWAIHSQPLKTHTHSLSPTYTIE